MQNDNHPVKNTAKIISIIILSPILLLTLIFAWGYVTHPIFDKFDQDRFTKLDTQMQSLFHDLKTTSNNIDIWKYAAVCSANKSGWMITGDYNCITSISTQKAVTSVQEVNSMQEKYYSVINRSTILKQKTELDSELPGDFGKKFVVSSAEKRYIEKQTRIECRYLIQIGQTEGSVDEAKDNGEYGSPIVDKIGNATISFRCDETARDHWYTLVKSTSSLIP